MCNQRYRDTVCKNTHTAIKIARKYTYEILGVPDNQAIILSATSCFHGRTLQAVSMSTDPEAREHFGPLVPGHVKVRYNDLEDLEAKLQEYNGRVAGFLVEPIQGEAGIIVPDDGYLRKSYELCKKYNTLYIGDEIQSGIGRSGKLLANDYEQVKPDILILGKSLTGGVCIASAVLASAQVMQVMTPGIHGSTYGGNPLSCAVSVEALKALKEENMIENSYKQGQKFRQGMVELQQQYPEILTNVRGKGLFNGITLNPTYEKTATDLC
uniref:Ornithine aminotransferase n=1 Tax=Lygus hesperus TaxID=30085 RepID=A0A0A9VSC9_LYGHE